MALLPERMQRLRHPRQRMLSICRDLVPVLLHVQQDALQDREPRLYDEEDGRFDRHQVEHDASRQQRDAHDDDERVHRVLQHVGEWVVGVPVLDVDRVEELDEKSERDRQAEESTLRERAVGTVDGSFGRWCGGQDEESSLNAHSGTACRASQHSSERGTGG
eukprot:611245-Prymnesium_polylepis.2